MVQMSSHLFGQCWSTLYNLLRITNVIPFEYEEEIYSPISWVCHFHKVGGRNTFINLAKLHTEWHYSPPDYLSSYILPIVATKRTLYWFHNHKIWYSPFSATYNSLQAFSTMFQPFIFKKTWKYKREKERDQG